jgi:hypothetical protein
MTEVSRLNVSTKRNVINAISETFRLDRRMDLSTKITELSCDLPLLMMVVTLVASMSSPECK